MQLCTLGLVLTLLIGNRTSLLRGSSSSSNKWRQGILPTTKLSSSKILENLLSANSAINTGSPRYGRPLVPQDLFFDKEVHAALKTIRKLYQTNGNRASSSSTVTTAVTGSGVMAMEKDTDGNGCSVRRVEQEDKVRLDEALETLKYSGGRDQATLTLMGHKGGKMEDQINQDRAFVISPFYFNEGLELERDSVSLSTHGTDGVKNNNRLLAVFDGHSKHGELVSEYAATNLPKILSSKLDSILSASPPSTASTTPTDKSESIQKVLVDTFVEIDKTAPADPSGGCTASIILQLGHQIYVANVGDSRSLIATYTKSTSTVNVIYVTREDKPDIPQERERVEKMGGEVYIPPPERAKNGASSRVLVLDQMTNQMHGLAMSRSIGDWDAGKLGVIPNPTIAVLDVLELLGSVASGTADTDVSDGDVEVFAVSATDGLLDFVDIETIVKTVAHSLYEEEGSHLLSACDSLISTAAMAWSKKMNWQYRDDISIAVSKISL